MKSQSARMSGKSVFAHLGKSVSLFEPVDLLCSASTIPDSLIPSRTAALVSQYITQKNPASIASCNISAKNPTSAITISSLPVVVAESTAPVCTPSAKNEEPVRVPPVGLGLGECTLSVAAQVLITTQRLLDGKTYFKKGSKARARAEVNQRVLADSIIQFKAA